MAGEFGGPPGVPEFQAPKSDDSSDSEKKKSVFGFIKRREGEDEATKAEAAKAHAETDDDDDEKDGNWFQMLSKKIGGSVAVGSVEDGSKDEAHNEEVEAPDTETTVDTTEEPVEALEASPYSFVEETPAQAEETAPSIPEFAPDTLDDSTEEMGEIDEVNDVEPHIEQEVTTPEIEEPVEDEPEEVALPPTAPPPFLPNLPSVEVPMEMPEDESEGDVDDTTVTQNDGGGATAGTLNIPAPAPEALPPAPDVTANTNSALPAVAAGIGLYAHHRINKANREAEKQMKQTNQEAESTRKKEQLQQKVARAQAAWNPNTAPAPWAPPLETRSMPPKLEKTEKPKVEQALAVEQKEPQPLPETKKPEVSSSNEKIETKIPSVGDVLAERKTSLKTPEVATQKTPEQQPVDVLLKPELSDPVAEINLKQIEALAEQAIAIENQYERQHEAKDVSSVGDDWGGSGQAGQVSTDQLFQKDDPSVGLVPVATNRSAEPISGVDLTDPVNQYAMKMGAVTAVLIVLAVMIWSIVA